MLFCGAASFGRRTDATASVLPRRLFLRTAPRGVQVANDDKPAGMLRLGPFWSSSAAFGHAVIALHALMAWPENSEARRAYEAVRTADGLDRAERAFAAMPIDAGQTLREGRAMMVDSFRRRPDELGGLRTLIELPSRTEIMKRHAARTKTGMTAGILLGQVCVLDRCHPEIRMGASVSKAVKLIQTIGQPDLVLTSTSKIMEAWKFHRSVSHLWAANFNLVRSIGLGFDANVEALRHLLQLAVRFREVAIGVHPHGMKGEPWLQPEESLEIDCSGLDLMPSLDFLPHDESTLRRAGLVGRQA